MRDDLSRYLKIVGKREESYLAPDLIFPEIDRDPLRLFSKESPTGRQYIELEHCVIE